MVGGGWLVANVAWSGPMVSVPASGGLVACERDLVDCSTVLGSCDTALDACATDLTTCDNDLETCEASASAFPSTGQTTCWDNSGNVIFDCTGTGQDGDIQAGAELSYTDTGLTVIDNNTNLEWMKQDDNNGDCSVFPNSLDKNCFFTWNEAFAFVASLNTNEYAGHTDWRLPNVKELLSLLRYDGLPLISDEFDNACSSGCMVEMCSCLAGSGEYFSSTTYILESDPFIISSEFARSAYVVNLFNGIVTTSDKNISRQVRAVRGGLWLINL
jgi:hypothetical protein